MDTKFSIGDTINAAWEIVKKNIVVLVGATLIFFALFYTIYAVFIGSAMVGMTAYTDPSEAILAMFGLSFFICVIVLSLLAIFFSLGFLTMVLDAVDGKTPSFSAFKLSFRKVINALLAGLIFGIVVEVGFFLCIIPGIYLAMRLQYYLFYIIDEDCSALDALSNSWGRTQGMVLDLFLLNLVLGLIMFVGALCCGIGMLVAYPVMYVALALTYRNLSGGNNNVVNPTPQANPVQTPIDLAKKETESSTPENL